MMLSVSLAWKVFFYCYLAPMLALPHCLIRTRSLLSKMAVSDQLSGEKGVVMMAFICLLKGDGPCSPRRALRLGLVPDNGTKIRVFCVLLGANVIDVR